MEKGIRASVKTIRQVIRSDLTSMEWVDVTRKLHPVAFDSYDGSIRVIVLPTKQEGRYSVVIDDEDLGVSHHLLSPDRIKELLDININKIKESG